MATSKGDLCYFPRDLRLGSYGGDVNCLQQFLRHKGFSSPEMEPTGYYGDATEMAVKKWQQSSGIHTNDKGSVDLPSRVWYAKKHNLPAPDSGSADKDKHGQKKTCIDVCAEFGGVQDCQTRCVRSEDEKRHACREACQVAFSSACDRAFPVNAENGPQNYKICLQYLEPSCKDTCQSY